jgi:hypothetical protein
MVDNDDDETQQKDEKESGNCENDGGYQISASGLSYRHRKSVV